MKTLKYNSKVKDRAKIVVESEGEKYFDSKKVSENFKDYSNVASTLVNKLPAALNMFSTESMSFSTYYENKNVNTNSFILQPVTENFVYKELKNLNSKKSTGLDGINARFLKDGASEIKSVITFIINLSISTSEVPTELKHANVKPIYKNEQLQVSNYRPVSILNVVSKILERAVYVQFEKYLTEKNILYSHQSGFRKNTLLKPV